MGLWPRPRPVSIISIFIGLIQPGRWPSTVARLTVPACMRELFTHALHSDKVIIIASGRKKSLPGLLEMKPVAMVHWLGNASLFPSVSVFVSLRSSFSLVSLFFCVFGSLGMVFPQFFFLGSLFFFLSPVLSVFFLVPLLWSFAGFL